MLLGLEGVSATTSAVLTESAVVSSGSSRVAVLAESAVGSSSSSRVAVLAESAVVSSGSSRVVGRVAAAAVVWYWCSDYVAIAVAVV